MALTETDGFTEIEYGISGAAAKITNCTTLKFHQENVMDSSGLDVQYIRYTVRVQGYMLAQQTAATQITPNSSAGEAVQTAANQHVGLRKILTTPRLPFKMTMGTGGTNPTIILQANPVDSSGEDIDETFDVQGGPKPKDLAITHVIGNTSLKVEWEVVVCISPDCDEYSSSDVQRSRGILSNKWTCADDIDENFYLKSRVFVGEMKLSNPLVNPHDYRQLVVPPISPGMRVKSMSFKCSEDCLTLQYTVTHEEVTVTAPDPATSIRISHKVHIAENELEVAETLSISLKGDRNVNKQELIDLACIIADGKIRIRRLIPVQGIGVNTRLRHIEIVDESGTNQDNQIHAVFHMTHITPKNVRVPGAGNESLFTAIRRGIGQRIDGVMIADYDNTLTRGNRDGETPEFKGPISVVGAFAAHLQAKCQADHSVNAGTEGAAEVDTSLIASMSPEMELPSVTLDVYPDLDDLPDETWNSSHSDGSYQTYQIDSQYSESPLVFQAPLSASTFYGTSTPSSADYAAEDGDSSVFIRLGPSQWKRTVRILAQRHALPPRLPEPLASFRDEDNVLNVLLGREVSFSEPQRSANSDNLRDYIVRAEYVYGMSRAPAKFKAGIPDTDVAEDPEAESSMYSFTLATIFSSDHAVG